MEVLDRYLVRHACERDATRIAGIHVRSWQQAYRGLVPDGMLDALDPIQRALVWKELLGTPEETVLVVLRRERMAGFGSLLPSRDKDAPPGTGEIASFYIDPPAWGRGAGRHLMAEVIRQAGEQRFKRVTLWVLAGNERARRFYEMAGFTADGAERNEVKQGFEIPVLRYAKEL